MEKFGYGVISACRFRVTDVALYGYRRQLWGFWVANAWYNSFAISLAMARSRALRFKLMSIRRHHQKDPPRRILRKLPKTRRLQTRRRVACSAVPGTSGVCSGAIELIELSEGALGAWTSETTGKGVLRGAVARLFLCSNGLLRTCPDRNRTNLIGIALYGVAAMAGPQTPRELADRMPGLHERGRALA